MALLHTSPMPATAFVCELPPVQGPPWPKPVLQPPGVGGPVYFHPSKDRPILKGKVVLNPGPIQV